ncbi:MAG: hypothetical protein OEZ58_04635 [Gammaproteobacteria bacterium]|nr:hypothetical protein [Gammaproteobacteria bacterium]
MMGLVDCSKPRISISQSTSIFILTLVLTTNLVAQENTPVPPGFKRLSNGDVVVQDILQAIPPDGYYISKDARLKKIEVKEILVSEVLPADMEDDLPDIPIGFHRMDNGDIMANNPAKAVAPPGFVLDENGVLKELKVAQAEEALPDLPIGFHRMPDGTIMANNPSKAVAPAGFYLLPDGTLKAGKADVNISKQAAVRSSGMLMFDYRYTHMYMQGLLDQTTFVPLVDAVDLTQQYKYMMVPRNMSMDMHMLMLMYHTREYMLMGMLHYMSNSMEMYSRDETASQMYSKGLADSVVTATFAGPKNISFMVGMSFPTGSTDVRGPMTHLAGIVTQEKYPYGMQLGSGSYEFKQGITIESPIQFLQWSLSYEYTARLNRNKHDYRLGNILQSNAWLKMNFTNNISAKVTAQARNVETTLGFDAENEANREMSPAMDARNYGGRRFDLGFGLRYENSKMTSVDLSFSAPVYQDLNGPQMKTLWLANVGLGYMF